jgi:hypothetical protein
VAAPANASPADPPGQPPIPVAVPSAHLHLKVLRRPVEFALAATVGMEHHFADPRITAGQRHRQRAGNQFLAHMISDSPADHLA